MPRPGVGIMEWVNFTLAKKTFLWWQYFKLLLLPLFFTYFFHHFTIFSPHKKRNFRNLKLQEFSFSFFLLVFRNQYRIQSPLLHWGRKCFFLSYFLYNIFFSFFSIFLLIFVQILLSKQTRCLVLFNGQKLNVEFV